MPKQAWHNRIVGTGEERPDDLLANPLNARIHPTEQQKALTSVLNRYGVIQTVIVNQRTNRIVDGHLRVQLAMRSNQQTIPVTYVDLMPDEEAAMVTAFDFVGDMAARDAQLLDDALRQIQSDDAGIQELMSRIAEDAGLIPALEGEADQFIDKPQTTCPNCGHSF